MKCHTVWDQDYNACINLLALYNHDSKVGILYEYYISCHYFLYFIGVINIESY